MDSVLLQGFLAQAESCLPTIRSGILVCAQTGNTYGELNNSLRQTIAVKDAAAIVELFDAARIAGELEEQLKIFSEQKSVLTGDQSRGLLDKLIELEASIAHLNFSTDDFSIHVADFLDASFENLGFNEPVVQSVAEAAEFAEKSEAEAFSADEWEEEFEIDEEMLEIFGEEAEELIQNIRVNLERLEKDTNDREALLEVRRNAHTLKGSAGIVGLKELSKVAHRVEDSLDYLAENEIAGNDRIFELLLTSTDCFAALAANETSAQLTKRIETLYLNFDELMIALKSAPLSEVQSPKSEVRSQSEPQISDLKLETENESVISNLKSEIVEAQTTDDEQRIPDEELKNEEPNTKDQKPKTEDPKEIAHHKSVVRVSLEKLDDLVKIMSGLVVSRSVFEQRLAELEQQISELHNSTRRLGFATSKIETDFEADMLNTVSSPLSVVSRSAFQTSLLPGSKQRTADSGQKFDSLELDRYTEFHQTMRELIETTGDTSAINGELDTLRSNLETLFENQRHLIEEMQDKLLRLRLVSFGSLGVRLQRTVRVTADEEGKWAELQIEGENLEVDTQILDALIEPMLHLLRNAVAHGIEPPEVRRLLGKSETGRIKIRVFDEGTHFVLTITDDGRGISAAAIKAKAVQHRIISESEADAMSEQEAFALIFHAGLTTAEEVTQVAGRGVGMNVVKTSIERQQGSISIESETHRGTTFTVRLPMALAVTRALLVKIGEQTFAVPLRLIKQITEISHAELQQTKTEQIIRLGAAIYKFIHLNEVLNLSSAADSLKNDKVSLLLVEIAGRSYALPVGEIIKPEEIVIKPLGNPLRNMPEFLGATILGDGSVVPVLDLTHLLKIEVQTPKSKVQTQERPFETDNQRLKTKDQKPLNILIVDDSPSVRHLTSNIIKNAGWNAILAKDGLEALDVLQDLRRELPDVILSDVEMPRMNGYELLAALKKQENLRAIPVVMITSRANDKHRQKAVDLGVSEYLTKPFDDAKLIEVIKDLSV